MPELLDALQAHFGFSSFRPGQEEAVEAALAGRGLLVAMPAAPASRSANSFRP